MIEKKRLKKQLKAYSPLWRKSLILSPRSRLKLTRYAVLCPLCGCPYLIKYGIHPNSKQQKYKCKFCEYQFTLNSERPFRRYENAPEAVEKLKAAARKNIF